MLVLGTAFGSAMFPTTKTQTATISETITVNHTTTLVSIPNNETYFAIYNETCNVLFIAEAFPAPFQYPIYNVSTCCTNFTFTYTATTYTSTVPVVQVLIPSYIVSNIGTVTETASGIPGLDWNETVCTYTG